MSIEEKREALNDADLNEVSGGIIQKGSGYKKYIVMNEETGKLVGQYHTRKGALDADEKANGAYREKQMSERLHH